MAGKLNNEQEKRLGELNQECAKCIKRLEENYQHIDRKACMICPIGMEIHKLDRDDIDGHNGRYERFYTA